MPAPPSHPARRLLTRRPAAAWLLAGLLAAGPASLAVPAASAEVSGAARELRYDRRAVDPPVRVRFTTLDGRDVRGWLFGWTDDGLAVSQSRTVIHDLPWSDLPAADVATIRGDLLAAGDDKPDDWVRLGRHLLERGADEPAARPLAETALAHAAERQPELEGWVRRLVEEADAAEAARAAAAARLPADPTTPSPLGTYPDAWTGTWDVTLQPPEIAHRLRGTFAFGTAKSDDPQSFHQPAIMAQREPGFVNGEAPSYGGGVWPDWVEHYHNTTGDTLAAMNRAVARTTAEPAEAARYVQLLVNGDPEYAVPAAEAHLRVCDAAEVPRAVELLAAAYQRAGREADLAQLLRAGTAYRSEGSVEALPAPLRDAYLQLAVFRDDPDLRGKPHDPAATLHAARLALFRGDARTAARTLRHLEGVSLGGEQEETLRQLHRALTRGSAGLAASLAGRHTVLAELEATFTRLEETRRHDAAAVPLADRLEHLTVPELLGDLERTIHVFGRASIPAADRLLYLVEQRRWSGVELAAKPLYDVTFHVHKYYGPR